ncbi:hypothetical protein C8R46DRAFT_598076 [Mycena filopes]|nr:hypothetical protein C8R46DRAFT_598076 [Mycena filopes]
MPPAPGSLSVQISSLSAMDIRPSKTKNCVVKIRLDGKTIRKADLKDAQCKIEFNPPRSLESNSTLKVELVQRHFWPKHHETLAALDFSVQVAQQILKAQKVLHLNDHLFPGQSAEFHISFSMEPTATADLLAVGTTRATELQSLLDHLGKYSTFLQTVLALGLAASEANPIAKAVFASVDQIHKLLLEQSKCDDNITALLQDMTDVLGCITDVEQFVKSAQLKAAMEEVDPVVRATVNFLTEYSTQSPMARVLSLTFSGETRKQLDNLTQQFASLKHKFDRGLAVQSGMTLARMEIQLKSLLDSTVQDHQLQILRPKAPEIKQAVEPCMPETRLDILQSIQDWANDLNGPNVFWLHGYPGTGKSAIAMTVTTQLQESGRLASSFFFKREEFLSQTPAALWCSVAYDLVNIYPEIRSKVLQALDSGAVVPHITGHDDIFKKLIIKSLENQLSVPPGRMPIVVIDALDECGGLTASRPYQKQVLSAISRWKYLPSGVKLFVTSRNESSIHSVLGSMGSQCKVLEVGEKATLQSNQDIEKYLQHGFDAICQEYKSLPHPWPGPQDLKLLINAAAGLFIWASTVLKLVGDHHPEAELEHILQRLRKENRNQEEHLDPLGQLYQDLLASKFSSSRDAKVFQKVAGTILVAQRPLTAGEMDALVPSLTSVDLEFVCKQMSSVLDSESGLRFVHQSFVDFLVSLGEESHFNHKRIAHEQWMATACFVTMEEQLKFNIAGVESSYLCNDDIPGLAQRVPNHLYYACQFWSAHLSSTVEKTSMLSYVSSFMETELLFWLEVLSVRRVTSIAARELERLARWLPGPNDELRRDVQDAIAFVRNFGHPIAFSVPHIYVSALRFAPENSRIAKRYWGSGLMTVKLKSGGNLNWPVMQVVLVGHQDAITSVAFSPDGTRIVSGSWDKTVRVWDTETQTQIGALLGGHTGTVTSVAFSPDGTRIVSGSKDKTVRVWDTQTQAQIGVPLQGHTDTVFSVAFSPDGTRIVSGSSDDTVRVWDTEAQTQIRAPLEGHTDTVTSVAFSPDGTRIVSGSDDNTVRVWDTEAQTQIRAPLEGQTTSSRVDSASGGSHPSEHCIDVFHAETGPFLSTLSLQQDGWILGPHGQLILWVPHHLIEGHTDTVYSVAFSPDGTRIVSGSRDSTVRVWDTEAQTQIGAPLEGHTDTVTSVAFSPDGTRIVSGSWDKTVRVWDTEAQTQTGAPLEGHTDTVNSVAFSPNGTHIVSGSDDKTVRVWDTEAQTQTGAPLESHTDTVNSVAFSPDGTRIVSGSDDNTVRVWDTEAQTQIRAPLEGQTTSSRVDSASGGSHPSEHCIDVFHAETGPFLSTLSLQQDGWILGPHGQLILWVPHHLIEFLPRYPLLAILGTHPMITFHASTFYHGNQWPRSYAS